MKTIYLAGHGDWKIKDEYVQVPAGCSISFYTDSSKNMFTSDMKDIIRGTYNGSVRQKVEAFKNCPNYTLNPDGASYNECKQIIISRNDPNLGLIMYPSGPSWTLKQIFDYVSKKGLSFEFIWCCCRFTGLKDAGGKAVGVNGAQGTWGDRDNTGKLVAPGTGSDPSNLYYFNPTSNQVKNLV